MKDTILFLGTGAADWHSAEKSSEYRRFSSIMINDDLLIDAGPDIFEFEQDMGYTGLYNSVKNIIITHAHIDHYCPESIKKFENIGLWANAVSDSENPSVVTHKVEPFGEYEIGGYKIIALEAAHIAREGEKCLNYIIITPNGSTIFYGCDSAWIPPHSYKKVLEYKFDVMIFDGTIGDIPGDYRIFEHNSIAMVKIMCDTLKKQEVIKPNGRLMISHMAYTLHPIHDEIAKQLAPYGIIPAYDNMKIEL